MPRLQAILRHNYSEDDDGTYICVTFDEDPGVIIYRSTVFYWDWEYRIPGAATWIKDVGPLHTSRESRRLWPFENERYLEVRGVTYEDDSITRIGTFGVPILLDRENSVPRSSVNQLGTSRLYINANGSGSILSFTRLSYVQWPDSNSWYLERLQDDNSWLEISSIDTLTNNLLVNVGSSITATFRGRPGFIREDGTIVYGPYSPEVTWVSAVAPLFYATNIADDEFSIEIETSDGGLPATITGTYFDGEGMALTPLISESVVSVPSVNNFTFPTDGAAARVYVRDSVGFGSDVIVVNQDYNPMTVDGTLDIATGPIALPLPTDTYFILGYFNTPPTPLADELSAYYNTVEGAWYHNTDNFALWQIETLDGITANTLVNGIWLRSSVLSDGTQTAIDATGNYSSHDAATDVLLSRLDPDEYESTVDRRILYYIEEL